MKKIILIILVITCNYNVFGQSTFNSTTLIDAINQYVKQQNPEIIKVEIKQTLKPQKFSQKEVIANISHKGELLGNCKVTLIFSYNSQILSEMVVRINAIPEQIITDNISIKQVQINKGDKVNLLHYSGSVCIKTDGFAVENGRTGDIIKVKKDNNQTLYGFIADDGNIIIKDKKNINK